MIFNVFLMDIRKHALQTQRTVMVTLHPTECAELVWFRVNYIQLLCVCNCALKAVSF